MHRGAADWELTEVPQTGTKTYVIWLIMESLGSSVAAMKPIGEATCIQLAREVLAALKVLYNYDGACASF